MINLKKEQPQVRRQFRAKNGTEQSVLELLPHKKSRGDDFAERLERLRKDLDKDRRKSNRKKLLSFPSGTKTRSREFRNNGYLDILETVQLDRFDALFIASFLLALAVLMMTVLSPGHSLGMYVNSQSLYLPQNLNTGAFIGLNEIIPVEETEEIIDVDSSQFDALEVSEYEVQAGDTLGQIALDHDLNMDTLISFNQISDVRRMQVGQQYKIPNRDGLLHKVTSGDSLSSLSTEYNSSLNAILDANSMTSSEILPGQTIFIPGARMASNDLKLVLGELFLMPTYGRFTSAFGYRSDPFTGARRFHNGVDWANAVGTGIKAAMAGTVVHVESQIGNYGKFIIVQHPMGFQTLYAHLDTILVRRGEYVTQGERIGLMGSTGRSTGSHLHFSIIKNGTFVNPLAYLH